MAGGRRSRGKCPTFCAKGLKITRRAKSASLLFLFHCDSNRSDRRKPDLIPLHLRDEAAIHVVMMTLVTSLATHLPKAGMARGTSKNRRHASHCACHCFSSRGAAAGMGSTSLRPIHSLTRTRADCRPKYHGAL